MPADDGLAPEVADCLEDECGSVADAVLIVLKSPGIGDELVARGVVDLSGFGPTEVYVPPHQERWVYGRVAEFHGCGGMPKTTASREAEWNDPPTLTRRPRRRPSLHDKETIHLVLVTEGTEAARRAAGWASNRDVVRAEKIRQMGLFIADDDGFWVDAQRVMMRGEQVAPASARRGRVGVARPILHAD